MGSGWIRAITSPQPSTLRSLHRGQAHANAAAGSQDRVAGSQDREVGCVATAARGGETLVPMASAYVPLSRVCLGRCKIISTVRGAAAFLPEVDGFSTAEVPLYDVSASRRRAGSCQRQVHHCGAGAVKLPCRLPLHRRLLSGRNQHLRPGYQQLHLRRPDLCV